MNRVDTKISVIVISDTNAPDLLKTVESVLSQTYQHVECLVADTVSSSECSEVIANKKEQLAHWISEKCDNKYQLIPKIVPHATGDFVYIIESGRFLSAVDALEKMMQGAGQHDIIYGNLLKTSQYTAKAQAVKFGEVITVDKLMNEMTDLFVVSIVRRALYSDDFLYNVAQKHTVGWSFLLKEIFLNKAKVHYVDVDLVTVPVGRHGGIGMLSNINHATSERERILQALLPDESARLIAAKYAVGKMPSFTQRAFNFLNKRIKYTLRSIRSAVEFAAYRKKYLEECYTIPIIINNKNHLSYLTRLIASLERRGYKNLYIIDNASTYPPLLKYYEETPYKVFQLNANVGFCALWDTDVFDLFKDQYYVYTDSDLELVAECPDDFMVVMHYLLNKYSLGKVGFSLLIDDLPEHYSNRTEVRKWESMFRANKIERLAYQARVDTTFALYKPNTFGDAAMLAGFRTSYPYSARHLPWYENTNALTEEQKYYYVNATTSTHWSSKIKV